jgi:serine/threonine-protein kinase Chk2
MLTVDVEKRITIDECLEHPWTTGRTDGQNDVGASMESTDGLTGEMGKLDFSKRKPVRERTLLSSINDATFFKTQATEKDDRDIKIWEQNKDQDKKTNVKEEAPAHERNPDEFVKMGGKGDETLYGDEEIAKEKAKAEETTA